MTRERFWSELVASVDRLLQSVPLLIRLRWGERRIVLSLPLLSLQYLVRGRGLSVWISCPSTRLKSILSNRWWSLKSYLRIRTRQAGATSDGGEASSKSFTLYAMPGGTTQRISPKEEPSTHLKGNSQTDKRKRLINCLASSIDMPVSILFPRPGGSIEAFGAASTGAEEKIHLTRCCFSGPTLHGPR